MYELPTVCDRPRHESRRKNSTDQLVMCVGDLPQSAVIERYFQERGWKVHLADSGFDARQLVRQYAAGTALLIEESPALESGWLTCWKLLSEAPETRVIVLGSSHVERGERRAEIVGATAYLRETTPASRIFQVLCSTA